MEPANFKPSNPNVCDLIMNWSLPVAEFKKKYCGKLINKGCYRTVYELKKNPNYVVKIERDMLHGTFANVTEWRNYIDYKEWDYLGPWLAPCEGISTDGKILIQKRVYHKKRKDYPKYIPAIFSDLKLANFGWIDDHFVCCDYSYFPIYSIAIGKSKMKYAKWWGTLKNLKK